MKKKLNNKKKNKKRGKTLWNSKKWRNKVEKILIVTQWLFSINSKIPYAMGKQNTAVATAEAIDEATKTGE